jgi:hypothetical protein
MAEKLAFSLSAKGREEGKGRREEGKGMEFDNRSLRAL